ncbi:MAG: pyrroloquinoline quinone biosynthesis protein PqqB [Planctomycetes bacterium]|nr:pyrroloquinoline quinone biosynthesis protein PqqB [Planctomycetota bacterium]MCP4770248.1 pyrroloquinoline quinone biosynthesis protein PqqB [Planctomycetota bacterium]MCP4860604.1 pyrroloquinoline quinone biosynthesis protein PqqB [Planctomycetota bacterium]
MDLRAAVMILCLVASCATSPTLSNSPNRSNDPYLQVLGVAQDAGYPQSGCYKPHCQRAWQDHDAQRFVASLAYVDGAAQQKFLFDATPDLPAQLQLLQAAAPDSEVEMSGVFLTHGHMGHYTGLMHFGREAQGTSGVAVFAMPRMFEYLTQNGPWSQLVSLGNIKLYALSPSQPLQVNPNLQVTPLLVPHRDEFTETVGYLIEGPQKTALFLPDIDKWNRWETDIRALVAQVDYALLDATFFASDELPGRDMSEIPHPYVEESFALFADLPAVEKAKIHFIHFNHTNPLLIDGSAAQQEVEHRGFHVAKQGMILPM